MNILIGSSSRDEINEEYLDLATNIAQIAKDKGYDLVFGAASTGMMGQTRKYFKTVYSYTVKKYEKDLENIDSKEEYVLETTFDRTKEMFKKSDIILFLPGGTGTYSELFGILEENRSIDKPKKVIIYNYNNYFDKALSIIDDCINNNFNSKDIKDHYIVIKTQEELEKAL